MFFFFKKSNVKKSTCYVAVFRMDFIMKQFLLNTFIELLSVLLNHKNVNSSSVLSEVYMLLMVHISTFRFGENMDFNSRMEMDSRC